jgi:hypothetical protein
MPVILANRKGEIGRITDPGQPGVGEKLVRLHPNGKKDECRSHTCHPGQKVRSYFRNNRRKMLEM